MKNKDEIIKQLRADLNKANNLLKNTVKIYVTDIDSNGVHNTGFKEMLTNLTEVRLFLSSQNK